MPGVLKAPQDQHSYEVAEVQARSRRVDAVIQGGIARLKQLPQSRLVGVILQQAAGPEIINNSRSSHVAPRYEIKSQAAFQ